MKGHSLKIITRLFCSHAILLKPDKVQQQRLIKKIARPLALSAQWSRVYISHVCRSSPQTDISHMTVCNESTHDDSE